MHTKEDDLKPQIILYSYVLRLRGRYISVYNASMFMKGFAAHGLSLDYEVLLASLGIFHRSLMATGAWLSSNHLTSGMRSSISLTPVH